MTTTATPDARVSTDTFAYFTPITPAAYHGRGQITTTSDHADRLGRPIVSVSIHENHGGEPYPVSVASVYMTADEAQAVADQILAAAAHARTA